MKFMDDQITVTRCTNRPECPCNFCVTVRDDIATGRDAKTQEDRIALDFIREYRREQFNDET